MIEPTTIVMAADPGETPHPGDQPGEIAPGLYEVLYRQLTFRECWHLGGGFPLGVLPLIAKVWGWRDLVWLLPQERPCAASAWLCGWPCSRTWDSSGALTSNPKTD